MAEHVSSPAESKSRLKSIVNREALLFISVETLPNASRSVKIASSFCSGEKKQHHM